MYATQIVFQQINVYTHQEENTRPLLSIVHFLQKFKQIIASLATICAVTTAAVQTASTKTNATKPIINPSKSTHLKDVRKRQLDEYGNYINSPYNSNVYHSPITGPIFQRRISTGNGGGYSLHEPRSYFPSSNFYEQNSLFTNNNNNNYDQHSIPSYAVQMEPLTQYSQRDPFNPGFIEHNSYSGGGGGSGLSYGPQQNIRYIEAPEPIIEIIIKDSNDSLPAQHLSIPLPAVPKKHKKEQVQVFYVKYKKDEHKGLIIEDPIPALSPTAYHQENQDEDDAHHEEHGSYEVTTPSAIPLKTTTLRTIIHPDSEKYHSNSGIQVTFNTESKHGLNNGQQYQEHIEESALQPVITDVNPRNFPSNVGVNRGPSPPQSPQSSQHQQYPSQYHLNQFQQDEQFRSHRYDGEQFHNYQQQQQQRRPAFHQELPFQNSPYQPFRSGGPPEQHHHQQQQQQQFNSNRFYQTQHHDHRQFGIVDQPPQQQQHPLPSQTPPFDTSNRNFENVRFPSPNEFVQQNNNHHQQQQQFHQPRPIPIPIHNEAPPQPLPSSSSSSSFGQIQTQFHPQTQATFNKFNQFENRPPPPSQQQFNGPPSFNRKPSHPPQPPPPPPRPQQSQPQPQQQQQFQRPPQPQRINEQKFTHLKPIQQFSTNNQQQPQHLHPINQSPFSHPSGPPPPPPPSSRPIIPSQQQQQQQQFNRNQYSEYQQHQQQQFQQNYQSNFQPNFNINNGQNSFHSDNLNNIAPGAELIESVPKFETHITETVPISQINQPFLSGSSSQQQQQRQQQSFQSTVQPYQQQQQQQQQQHPLSNDEFLKQDIQYASVQTNLLTSPQPTRPTTYSSSTISNLDNNNKNGPLSREQYRDEIHQQFIKYVDDYPQASPSPHLQIIPNSAPIQQKLIPGQSVSNLATEVFPSFERQQQQYFSQATASTYHQQQQQQNHQQEQLVAPLSGRHNNNNNNNKVTVEQTISVTQKPSQYYPSSTQRQQSTIDYHKSVTPSSAKSLSSSSSSITANHIVSSTTAKPPTVKPKSKQKIELPDEVPDDLRAQLLSSGILDNADISILDYDKIGDVDLANLPPEHLANFYGAGGASQIASSNKILTVVKPNGDRIIDLKLKTSELTNKKASQLDEHKNQKSFTPTTNKKHNVDLKVVRFDSNNQKSITDKYIKYDSTVLPSVSITNPEQLQQQQQQQYNRYLPLKVNGAQFPIPDVSELKGKRISSVVVLAPVDNLQSVESYDDEADAVKRSTNEGRSISSNNRGRTNDNDDYSSSSSSSSSGESRVERDIIDSKHVKFIAGDTLKQLLKKPTKDNFKKWLDKESKTDIDLQSVVLLVTRNANDEQEIFMYDIVSHKVNKLKGELSSAFVNVAESNANADDIDNGSISDSGILEKMIAKPKAAVANDENSASENFDNGSSSQSSSSIGINNRQQTANRKNHQLTINSGYSAIKS